MTDQELLDALTARRISIDWPDCAEPGEPPEIRCHATLPDGRGVCSSDARAAIRALLENV